MDKIKLNRAQIRYSGKDRLDITIKSASGWALRLAPTWNMVWSHKQGTISNEEYRQRYFAILDRIEFPLKELLDFGKDGTITFVCYCSDGKFCHTYLLIDYLISTYPEYFDRAKEKKDED